MSQTVTIIFVVLLAVLYGAFLLSIFCGVFEERTKEDYRFRSNRFIMAVAVLFAANIFTVLAILPEMKNKMLDGSHAAESAVLRNRAMADYALENLGVFFPEIIKDENKECYRAALSNYVEDDWDESFKVTMWQHEALFCKQNPSICNGKQDDYLGAIREKVNPFHLLLRDLTAIGYFLGTDWMTGAESYRKVRQFTRQPDSKGNALPPPDELRLANYKKYWANCSSLKPLPWVLPSEPLLRSEATFCVGICP